MEIFKPIKEVDETKLHPKFKLLRDEIQLRAEKEILESWTHGLIDKDHEAIREFQESFHSRFWEFYLFKLLTHAGFTLDHGHQVPDYIVLSAADVGTAGSIVVRSATFSLSYVAAIRPCSR